MTNSARAQPTRHASGGGRTDVDREFVPTRNTTQEKRAREIQRQHASCTTAYCNGALMRLKWTWHWREVPCLAGILRKATTPMMHKAFRAALAPSDQALARPFACPAMGVRALSWTPPCPA